MILAKATVAHPKKYRQVILLAIFSGLTSIARKLVVNEKIKDAIRNLSRTDRVAFYSWIDEEAAIDLDFSGLP